MSGPFAVRSSMDTHITVGEGRCQSCAGFRHATIELTMVLDFGWASGEPFVRQIEQETYAIDLCAKCIDRLSRGEDIRATSVVDVVVDDLTGAVG